MNTKKERKKERKKETNKQTSFYNTTNNSKLSVLYILRYLYLLGPGVA